MCALQSGRPQPEYPCSQQDLYTIVETGWGSFTQHLPKFELLSTKYTAATAAVQLAAVQSARALPDEDSRDEVHKSLRVQLKGLSEACLIKWSDMGTYIRDGFSEEEYENKRLAAGYNYYYGAQHLNWDDVKGLMQNGLLFLHANDTLLTDEGGMPATFIPDFDLVKGAFESKHQAFLQSMEEAKVLGDQKVVANSALYRALIKMFTDGKKVSRNDAAVREQFTFDRVWHLVGNSGSGTGVPATVIEIGAYLFDEETGVAIEGARLTVMNADDGSSFSAVSGADGTLTLRIPGYEPNETVMIEASVSAENYDSDMVEMELTAGNFYSVEIGMRRIVN